MQSFVAEAPASRVAPEHTAHRDDVGIPIFTLRKSPLVSATKAPSHLYCHWQLILTVSAQLECLFRTWPHLVVSPLSLMTGNRSLQYHGGGLVIVIPGKTGR